LYGYIIQKLLPWLKDFNQDQKSEKKLEAKIKGYTCINCVTSFAVISDSIFFPNTWFHDRGQTEKVKIKGSFL